MTDDELRALAERLKRLDGDQADTALMLSDDVAAAILGLMEERDRLKQLDAEASDHIEAVICMRSGHFTGEPPYVGWEGLGLALNQDYDDLALAKSRLSKAVEALRLITENPYISHAAEIQTGAAIAVERARSVLAEIGGLE